MTFDRMLNNTLIGIGVIYGVVKLYRNHQIKLDEQLKVEAMDWGREATSRFFTFHKYLLSKRPSKEAYIEALTAAQNVLWFESEELCPNNVFTRAEVRELCAKIDAFIAIANKV